MKMCGELILMFVCINIRKIIFALQKLWKLQDMSMENALDNYGNKSLKFIIIVQLA